MSTMHGRKAGGAPITDEMVETIADEAERGGDVEQLLRVRRGGRPSMGTAAASVESRPAPRRSSTISASVRLDPEIKSDLPLRASCFRSRHCRSAAASPTINWL